MGDQNESEPTWPSESKTKYGTCLCKNNATHSTITVIYRIWYFYIIISLAIRKHCIYSIYNFSNLNPSLAYYRVLVYKSKSHLYIHLQWRSESIENYYIVIRVFCMENQVTRQNLQIIWIAWQAVRLQICAIFNWLGPNELTKHKSIHEPTELKIMYIIS